jgi:hypothetical protein
LWYIRGVKRVFLLSPARTGGERAQLIFNPNAGFELARRLQRGEAAPIAEIFSFLSGLYFRGKVTYAGTFMNPPAGVPGALVITSNRGLLPVQTPITLKELRAFASVDVDHLEDLFKGPLKRDAVALLNYLPRRADVVLLGSISTRKYTATLLEVFRERLKFPSAFVGRGDMSRGGLLLRAVASGKELEYAPVLGAVLKGKRPERLGPIDPALRALYNKLSRSQASGAKRY